VFPAAGGVLMRSLAILIIAAILIIPVTAEIDGSIKKVDWSEASVSGACPPIDYRPSVTIMNTGDEKAKFYVTLSVTNQRGKELRSGCLSTQEIEPGDSVAVWPFSVKLTARYNRVEVTLYASSCLTSTILDTEPHTIELKDCKGKR
jgi:hypothetical protein